MQPSAADPLDRDSVQLFPIVFELGLNHAGECGHIRALGRQVLKHRPRRQRLTEEMLTGVLPI